MVRAYQHSAVFDEYKRTKEDIRDNLTSLQYLQTLDYLLWQAIDPILVECPSLFNNYVAKITDANLLKHPPSLPLRIEQKLPVHLFNILTADLPKRAHDEAKASKINRGLLFGFVALFCSHLKFYERLQSPLYTIGTTERLSLIETIEQRMGLRIDGNLYAALLQVKYWEEKARWFKAKIVQKYTRMAILQAKSTYRDYNHSVYLDDVVQIYLMTVNRAIDRCDADQGVLTTFIQSWFKSAKSEVAKLAKGQHDQSYESLNDEHGDAISEILGFAMPDESNELQEHCACIAKQADPEGMIRAALGIPEFVTLQQREMLEMFVEQ